MGVQRGVSADAAGVLDGANGPVVVTQEHGAEDPQMQVRILDRSTNFLAIVGFRFLSCIG